jgi:hypothetical protein
MSINGQLKATSRRLAKKTASMAVVLNGPTRVSCQQVTGCVARSRHTASLIWLVALGLWMVLSAFGYSWAATEQVLESWCCTSKRSARSCPGRCSSLIGSRSLNTMLQQNGRRRTGHFVQHSISGTDGRVGFKMTILSTGLVGIQREHIDRGARVGFGQHFDGVAQLMSHRCDQLIAPLGAVEAVGVNQDSQKPETTGRRDREQKTVVHAVATMTVFHVHDPIRFVDRGYQPAKCRRLDGAACQQIADEGRRRPHPWDCSGILCGDCRGHAAGQRGYAPYVGSMGAPTFGPR